MRDDKYREVAKDEQNLMPEWVEDVESNPWEEFTDGEGPELL